MNRKEFTPSALRKLSCFADDYFDLTDDEDGGASGGGGGLAAAIISAGGQVGAAAILAGNSGTQYQTPTLSRPVYASPSLSTGSGFMSVIVIVVLAIVGFFAYKKL